ncbi:uncharacterized protein LOC106881800 [Octopus bimaculoides]|uniref:Uncharacterized protein n=1 Tax=Octopus bimaculoides TaxID=37653 RepID=A0A0L8FRC3_OCTBM|nr:uncharacterized protein LOC106881800 [Octopus bimaculoides]XP_052823081.1 uncharacterized protein LOC106881800 [Octopus bimaculoides]|eukprot:XP_014787797.1 PREDICTED: uncharacterized protein LOC106881800 [Octopus bimaculoides]
MLLQRFIKNYQFLHHKLLRIFIVLLLLVQMFVVNYQLVHYEETQTYWCMLIPDSVYLVLFIVHIFFSYKKHFQGYELPNPERKQTFPFGPLTWVVYALVLSSKLIVVFTSFATEMEDENGINSANTLRAMFGLTAVVFFLLLMSYLHDTTPTSLKTFIYTVGATVPIDLLDTMDIMELLYEEEETRKISEGMVYMILVIIVGNLMIPMFPCTILYIQEFKSKRIFVHLMIAQKVIQIVVINLLFMSIRLILWQEFGQGFSAFIVKNILVMGILSYDLFRICREKAEDEQREEPVVNYKEGEVHM